jgi:N-acetylmuramic acid 6-phosphate etherase
MSLDELSTEASNPDTRDIDLLDSLSIVQRINDEDQGVAAVVRAVLPRVAEAVDLALEQWRRGGRVVLFGAGTSGRLAMLDAAEVGPTFGVSSERYVARMAGGQDAFRKAVEGAEDDRAAGALAADDLSPRDLGFGIAASGRTPWVIGALERAGVLGAATIGLACVANPEMAAYVDLCIAVDTGAEVISGSTRMKAGTAQKLVLNAFSTALMIQLGKVYSNLMVDVQATNTKLRRRAVRLIQQATSVDASAAADALNAADGSVKLAIVMLRLSLSPQESARRLETAGGRLREALGEMPS